MPRSALMWMALVVAGCAPATQITFDIRTDVPCEDTQAVGLAVGPTGTLEFKDPSVITSKCSADGTLNAIGTYSVVPAAGPIDVTVRVTIAPKGVNLEADCTAANGYRGCIVARRALTFIPRRGLVVPIDLLLVCRGVACDEFTTCNKLGRCVSARVDPNACQGDTCESTIPEPLPTGPAPVPGRSSLALTPDSLPADGVSSTAVTLTLNDVDGRPVANEPVFFNATGSDNRWSTSATATDDAGVFVARLASQAVERKTVTVGTATFSLSAGVSFVASDGGGGGVPSGDAGTDGGVADAGVDAGAFDGGFFPASDGGFCRKDLDCQDNNFCNGYELCTAGRCRAAARSSCDDDNPCSVDLCDEVQRSCSYSFTLVDADGDGHYPLACGGNADDCDDGDAFTWGGPLPAPERCDFKDNNCNGSIDEMLWLEKAGARTSVTSGGLYPLGVGPPVVRRVGSSLYLVAASDATARGSMDLFRLDGTNLNITAGPLKVFGSTTTWITNVNGPNTEYGRRVQRPGLEISDAGDLMVTGLTKSWPSPTTCSTALSRTSSSFGLVAADLSMVVDAGETAFYSPTSSGCSFWRGNENDAASAVWVPQIGSWVFVTPVSATTTKLYLEVTVLQPGGTLTTSRRLIDDGPLGPGAGVAQGSDASRKSIPRLAVGPLGVFVGWEDPNYGPRYALFSHDFTTLVAGPFTVQGQSQWDFRSLVFDGNVFLANIYNPGNTANNSLVRFTPDGARIPGVQVLPVPQLANSSVDFRSGLSSALAFAASKRALVLANTGPTGLVFGWGLNRADAGFLTVTVPIGAPATHSDFAIAPIDDKNVAVFWADGDIKRTILQCAP